MQHLHLHYSINRKGLTPLILSSVLRASAFSMLILFSSVYIYESAIDLDFTTTTAILLVIAFFMIHGIFKMIFLVMGENYSFEKGFKHTIWLSFVPFALFIPLMILSEKNFWLLFISGALWGAHGGLFWWGYHGYMVKAKHDHKYGQIIGSTVFLYTLASVLTPILGALIIENQGFNSMYIFAFFLVALSLFILGLDNDKHQKHNIKFLEVFFNIFKQPRLFLAYMARGISLDVYAIFWGLYLFLVFGSVLELGLIVSASVVISSFLMIFIGRYIDDHGEKKVLFLASPLLSLAWLSRFFFINLGAIIGANSVGGFGGRLLTLSLDDASYKNANKRYTGLALLYREMGLITGSLLILSTAAILVLTWGKFNLLFLIAAGTSLLPIIFAL